MSCLQITVRGTVAAEPVERTTKAGKRFLTLAVTIWDAKARADEWINVSVFEPLVSGLPADLAMGTAVCIEGRCGINRWTDKYGNRRANLWVTAQALTVMDAEHGRAAA